MHLVHNYIYCLSCRSVFIMHVDDWTASWAGGCDAPLSRPRHWTHPVKPWDLLGALPTDPRRTVRNCRPSVGDAISRVHRSSASQDDLNACLIGNLGSRRPQPVLLAGAMGGGSPRAQRRRPPPGSRRGTPTARRVDWRPRCPSRGSTSHTGHRCLVVAASSACCPPRARRGPRREHRHRRVVVGVRPRAYSVHSPGSAAPTCAHPMQGNPRCRCTFAASCSAFSKAPASTGSTRC